MIIDLTHTITSEMPVYPGTVPPVLESAGTLANRGWRETRLAISSHSGTHMDAPAHILADGSTLDQLPPSQFYGRAVALDVTHLEGGVITADYLRAQNGTLRTADFALFYTGWEQRWNTEAFFEDTFPVLDAEAAKYLVSCGLKGVGTDAFGVDRLASGDLAAHKILLRGGLVILENLCLKKVVGRTDFMLMALPLKYEHADGAPVRAVAQLGGDPFEKEMEQA
ncbi:cyclase family protein [Dysosmobacter sp. Phy]